MIESERICLPESAARSSLQYVRPDKTAEATSYYQPTPPPQTVVVHSIPKKTNDACCWGCAAALCLCFGLEECCS